MEVATRRWSVEPGDRATGLLIVLRLIVLLTVLIGTPAFPTATSGRYQQIASSNGTPYVDFDVEYMPGELAIAELVGWSGPTFARALLAVLAFAGDIATFVALRRGWGTTVARRYLYLGVPLLIFMYRRSDLVTVALATVGLALASGARERLGGASLGLGMLTRIWPAVLMPIWVVQRRMRALWICAAAVVGGVVAWVAVGGLGGVRQVSSFRGATGWEVESTVGVVVWALTGQHRFESGANRTGSIPGWTGAALLALLVVVLFAIWHRASGRTDDLVGRPALAAVAALLVVSPLLSPQYVIWLLPWIAVAGERDRRWSMLGSAPLVLTGAAVTGWYLDLGLGAGIDQAILFTRNGALLAIVVAYFLDRSRPRPDEPERSTSQARAR